jgi:hypothetical protein
VDTAVAWVSREDMEDQGMTSEDKEMALVGLETTALDEAAMAGDHKVVDLQCQWKSGEEVNKYRTEETLAVAGRGEEAAEGIDLEVRIHAFRIDDIHTTLYLWRHSKSSLLCLVFLLMGRLSTSYT